MQKLCLAALLAAASASSVTAQTVRGTIVGEGQRPVAGVVVALVDASNREVGRALTEADGDYRLTAPGPGTYRVRTLRIGYRSFVTDPIVLAAGDDVTRTIAVSTIAFTLDTVRAFGRNSCNVVARDSMSTVAAIWDQVRSALIATQLSLSRNLIYATSISYQRMLDARSQHVGSQSVNVRTEFARQPWTSLRPDSLRKVGYVFTTPDNARMYYAPDLAVLLSDAFTEDHCFRIARASDDRRLGIDFEPTPERSNTTEIRGTLWLDRGTNELQHLEYRYANRIRDDEERVAGGDVGFARLKNGLWALASWNIRMPVPVAVPVYSGSYRVSRYDLRLDSVKVTGGELVMATTTGMRRDTIWMRPTIALRGTVLDSTNGTPVRRAAVSLAGTTQSDTTDDAGRFEVPNVLPGSYTLNVTTPSLDSLNVVSEHGVMVVDSTTPITVRVPDARTVVAGMCGHPPAGAPGNGIVTGRVLRADSTPAADASVSAVWNEVSVGGALMAGRSRQASIQTDARGMFRLCGLPRPVSLVVSATTDSAEARPLHVDLGRDQSFARADLVVDRARGAAEPSPANPTLLDSVVTKAPSPPLSEFEKHRRMGQGYFLTPEDVTKRRSATTASLLQALPGLRISASQGGDWAYNSNQRCSSVDAVNSTDSAAYSTCSLFYQPDRDEARQGVTPRCYAKVYVDRTLMNPGIPTPPYNLRELTPREIESVEYYSSAAQMPVEYRNLNSGCGMIIIHTRR
jgi:hypothetical protein